MATVIKEPPRSSGLEGIFNWAKEVISRAILDGTLIEDVSVSSAGVTLDHKLGRVPRGAIIVKSSSVNNVVANEFTLESIALTSKSGSFTVSVWVF